MQKQQQGHDTPEERHRYRRGGLGEKRETASNGRTALSPRLQVTDGNLLALHEDEEFPFDSLSGRLAPPPIRNQNLFRDQDVPRN
jgi:hypothetical protein